MRKLNLCVFDELCLTGSTYTTAQQFNDRLGTWRRPAFC
jgi:hypothetical protein